MVYSANDKIDIQQKKGRRGLDHWNLIIKRVDPSDAGQYECQVSSAQAFVYLVQLTVIGNNTNYSIIDIVKFIFF